jgi:hypothetical protein
MFNRLALMKENTSAYPMSVSSSKTVFGEDYSMKIPANFFGFYWYLHLLNHLVIID